MSGATSPVAGAQAISRAMLVLRAVARERGDGAGLLSLTRDTGMSKPTVHRLLSALIAEGMVEQDADTRKYFLGPECRVLGSLAGDRHGMSRNAASVVARLARQCGDSAFFSLRSDVFAICMLREEGDYPLKTYVLMPGDRHPLGVGAGSLAMLSALPDDEVEECLQANAALIAAKHPDYSTDFLREQVAETRARGYALNRGGVVAGSWGMGVPLRDVSGRVMGALSIAAVASRLGEDRQPELSRMLLSEAQRLQDMDSKRQPGDKHVQASSHRGLVPHPLR